MNRFVAMGYGQFAVADQIEATIRKNLPACRSRYGAGREAFGYGE